MTPLLALCVLQGGVGGGGGGGSRSTDGGRRVSALAGARYWGKSWSRKARNREEQGFGARSGFEPQPSLGTV